MVRQARPAVVRITSGSGTGSGVIYDTQGRTGYVITNEHVVSGQSRVNVTVGDSTNYGGTVLGVDAVRDLAVVSICCGSFTTLEFGDVAGLEAGDEVVNIGYALGLSGEATVTRGIVSAIRYDSRYLSDVIQSDAVINPGNSGGPMLSGSGEILGINTFKYEETQSGRPTEGLGFAISGATVQQHIPRLRAGTAFPTPTPARPTPTPTPGSGEGYDFGPLSGELRHDLDDEFVETKHTGLRAANVMVEATFINPYAWRTGQDWSYGFLLRNGEDSDLRFAVSGYSRWKVDAYVAGSFHDLGGGRLDNLIVGAGGANHLMVVLLGDRGWFFVNGEFVVSVDASRVSAPGEVTIATNLYYDDGVHGAVTRYQDARGYRLINKYKANSGRIVQNDPGLIGVHDSNVWARDFVTEIEFKTPQGVDWDYGFVFRNPEYGRLDALSVTGDKWWRLQTRDVWDTEYTDIVDGWLYEAGIALRPTYNHLLLIAVGDSGWFFINGELVSKLDLRHNMDSGEITAAGDFYHGNNGRPEFRNFNVWAP